MRISITGKFGNPICLHVLFGAEEEIKKIEYIQDWLVWAYKIYLTLWPVDSYYVACTFLYRSTIHTDPSVCCGENEQTIVRNSSLQHIRSSHAFLNALVKSIERQFVSRSTACFFFSLCEYKRQNRQIHAHTAPHRREGKK